MQIEEHSPPNEQAFARKLLEVIAIASLFALLSWSPPPDVNEAHYLCKAKHFWNNHYCPNDLFLSSANAHWLFFATFGWLCNFFSLETSAWIGRIVCWIFVAAGWRHLASKLLAGRSAQIILTAAIFVLANRWGHLAGEWVVGGVESKCIAYGFALFAIGEFLNQKKISPWILLGLSVAFHALVGIWMTLIWTAALLVNRELEPCERMLIGLAIFLGISFLGIFPALQMNSGIDSDQVQEAYNVQVFQRLAHHQYLFAFAPVRFVAFFILTALWFVVACDTKTQRGFRLVHTAALFGLAVSLIGAVLSFVERADLLRFYWFRIADVIIPLAFVLALPKFFEKRVPYKKAFSLFAICLTLMGAVAHFADQVADPRPGTARQSLPQYAQQPERTYQTYKNWRKVCDWIKNNTPKDATFITPYQQQSFKWFAERAEVACWKDAPQDAEGLMEWRERMELPELCRGTGYEFLHLTDQQILDYAKKYGATYLVVPQSAFDLTLREEDPPQFEMVYPLSSDIKSTFVVFKLDE